MCDRTREFFSLIESISKSSPGSTVNSKARFEPPKTRSAFNDVASEIGKGIFKTSEILTKLTKLVRKQGLFDEPTEEINALILRIKHNIDELNSKCDSAQQYVDEKKRAAGKENQQSTYNVKVVSQLKTELMNATKDFKSVLEVRTNKMKDQQNRRIELAGNAILSPMKQFNASINQQNQNRSTNQSNPAMSNPYSIVSSKRPSPPQFGATNSDNIASFLQQNNQHQHLNQRSTSNYHDSSSNDNSDSSAPLLSQPHLSSSSQQQPQLLLAAPATEQYFEARSQAITEVEKTIQELGTLFKRITSMLSEQQELVERIDEDIETATDNAEKAKSLLLKTYDSVSSNNGLYMKIFGILGVFVLFFVLFLM